VNIQYYNALLRLPVKMTVGQRNLIIRFFLNEMGFNKNKEEDGYYTPPPSSCLFLHHHHHGDLLLLLLLLLLYCGEIRLPSQKNFPRMFSLVT